MIRKYENNDISEVTRIWLDSHIKTYGFISTDLWRNGTNDFAAAVQDSDVYVYIEKRHIEGFIMILDNRITGIFTSLGKHAKKVKSQLIEYVQANYSELSYLAPDKDADSIKLYKDHSFNIVGHEYNENTDDDDVILQWNA